MLRKFGFLINYIILYAVCILIFASLGEKEHKLITEYENKINNIVLSYGYVLDEDSIYTGIGKLSYNNGDNTIYYKYKHNYKETSFDDLKINVHYNYSDNIKSTVDIINKLVPSEQSISYYDVEKAILQYKMTNEEVKLTNSEDFDKYGMYYILSISKSNKLNKDFDIYYQTVSK